MALALSIKQLRKTYESGFEALKGIDLEVESGDFLALLGPNGAGKSTTIGIVTSLVNKTAGSVVIYGHDIDEALAAAKMHVGLVPQEFNFNQFEKVGDIVRTQGGYYGLDAGVAAERAERYLRQLGLWDKRDEQSRMLSGGMKRRLMIARALVHEPKLLILDEPTAGVDIELRRSMWEFLKEINRQGTTIILTTHYLEEAEQLCRNIAIIDRGEIIERSPMRAFLQRLDRETFVLELAHPLESLDHCPGVNGHLVDGHTLEVEVSRSESLNALFAQLDTCGIVVNGIRSKANRLEELFVSLLNEDKASSAPAEGSK